MNRKLINKYREAFNSWIDGNELLYTKTDFVSPSDWVHVPAVGSNINLFEDSDTLDNLLIVVNDKYVEFRKALIEGRTVQCNKYADNPNTWVTIDVSHIFNMPVSRYRIMSRTEFTKGMWVVASDGLPYIITRSKGEYYYLDGKESELQIDAAKASALTIWKPRSTEWVYVTNSVKHATPSYTPVYKLARIKRVVMNKYDSIKYRDDCGDLWDTCEPIICGRLPQLLHAE